METITLEQIDLIMQRANTSYQEAKEVLEQCGGDTVEALLLLEKSQKVKVQSNNSETCVKGFFSKLHAMSFTVSKNNTTYIDIPLTIAILAVLFCCHISIIAFVIALILGFKVDIQKPSTNKKVTSSINLTK